MKNHYGFQFFWLIALVLKCIKGRSCIRVKTVLIFNGFHDGVSIRQNKKKMYEIPRGLTARCQKRIFTISECDLSTSTENVMSVFRQDLLLGI